MKPMYCYVVTRLDYNDDVIDEFEITEMFEYSQLDMLHLSAWIKNDDIFKIDVYPTVYNPNMNMPICKLFEGTISDWNLGFCGSKSDSRFLLGKIRPS